VGRGKETKKSTRLQERKKGIKKRGGKKQKKISKKKHLL
jgi:hypothetical protein